MSQFGQRQSGFFSSIGGTGGFVSGAYGRFYDTTTQIATDINTPQIFKFNNSGITNNISLQNDNFGNPTRVTVGVTGTYIIEVSFQLHKTSSGLTSQANSWLRFNAVDSSGDVLNSTRVVTLANNGDLLLVCYNFMINMSVGQYIQTMWSVTSTTMHIDPQVANLSVPYPAGSSTVLTIFQI